MPTVKIVECPRDAWQGLPGIIPTEAKAAYLRKLIEAGFRHLDAVSFVAPKYVPQMADSEAVLEALYPLLTEPLALAAAALKLDVGERPPSGVSSAELRSPVSALGAEAMPDAPLPEVIGIVVNEQGLERALKAPGLTTIGYPYSVSANFRRANANMSKAESQALVEKLQQAVSAPGAPVRTLVIYISMAFGNNYEELWGPEIVEDAILWLGQIGVQQVSLADTIGTASPDEVAALYRAVQGAAAGMELGVHLHSRPEGAAEKVMAAYEAGCRRFDSALTGLGGCPFAGDDLVGNIPTEIVISTLSAAGVKTGIEPWALLSAVHATKEIRQQYGLPMTTH
ncbi:MAG TPA: hydroxymethylglutaryl-CoA lyase [Terriglobia bacterium]|nr:hydroxymethylglutaryl-CoA lyase [Terriglobia bacterium]